MSPMAPDLERLYVRFDEAIVALEHASRLAWRLRLIVFVVLLVEIAAIGLVLLALLAT